MSPVPPKSPLVSLRISTYPKNSPIKDDIKDDIKEIARHGSRRGRRGRLATEKKGVPGFDFDVAIPTEIHPDTERFRDLPQIEVTQLDSDKDTILHAKQLAQFLLDSGRTMNSKFNVVDPLGTPDRPMPVAEGRKPLHISPSCRNRTETVKAILALKYHWMERSMDWRPGEVNLHPGVDGVHNPLQIIRNRAVRAKHHEYPPPSPLKNLPLACNAFSRNHGPRPWKMAWGIELNELVNDNSWRSYHWNELRNAKGELWFAEVLSSTSSLEPSSKAKNRFSKRLHDRLWNEDDDEANVQNVAIKSARSKAPAAQRIKKKMKESARKLYGNTSSAGSASELDPIDFSSNENLKSFESLSKIKICHVTRPSEDCDPVDFETGALNGETEVNGHIEELSKSLEETNQPSILLQVEGPNDVVFTPLHTRNNLERVDCLPLDSPETPETGSPGILETEDTQLTALGAQESYLEKVIFLNTNYLVNIFPRLVKSTTSKVDDILSRDIVDLLHSIVQINDNQLPAQEALYAGFLNESKSLMRMANDRCAVRIDHLLSATDRSIGEINTSLTMDLRKVNEQVDRLNHSLFGNVVSDMIQEDPSLRFTDVGNYKVLYFCLENAIVILLRMVWIVVSVYKFALGILKFAWRIVTFFF